MFSLITIALSDPLLSNLKLSASAFTYFDGFDLEGIYTGKVSFVKTTTNVARLCLS